MKTKFNTKLFNAARNYIIEVCRNEDKYALIDYQEHLFEMYSPAVVELIMQEVVETLFNKYPIASEWLNSLALDDLEEGLPMIPILTADDLAYLLTTEGKADETNYKFHPTDEDKLIINKKGYTALKDILTNIYSSENVKVEVNIDDLVEVTESV